METAINFLAVNYPWILVVLVVVGAAIWLTRFIVLRLNTIHRVETDFEKFKSVSDCKVHHIAVSSTKEELKEARADIKSILEGISAIKTVIVSIQPKTASMFAKSNSPFQLNDMGRMLFEKSGADKILTDNGDIWVETLHKLGLKTELDVEEHARLLLLGLVNDDIFIPLKKYIYNNPVINDTTVSMDDMCYIIGIELRNLYLTKYQDTLQ